MPVGEDQPIDATLPVGEDQPMDATLPVAPSQCMVPANVRVDCGYPSVTKEECNNRGCCFDSSIRNVPWCFKPLQEAECTF
ncbi:hypothetical protein U0070_026389 [Myodes glareolus]|uniref:Trefoil factor 3 n=1 Tax=Myodes glareolus TaxID=447135 RepID=A0AAW0ILA0_MYOGA